jgi:hypothetical protein
MITIGDDHFTFSFLILYDNFPHFRYEDEDGQWRNEYDDQGYVFDPNTYEKPPEQVKNFPQSFEMQPINVHYRIRRSFILRKNFFRPKRNSKEKRLKLHPNVRFPFRPSPNQNHRNNLPFLIADGSGLSTGLSK